MSLVTSRGFVLPESPSEMSDGIWFNLWQSRLWPYKELQVGDDLFWYESPTKAIVWHTQVEHVEAFPYSSIGQALDVMDERFNVSIDRSQSYLDGKPTAGYCLAYQVNAIERVHLPKPEVVAKFNQQGWERGTRPEIAHWLEGDVPSSQPPSDFPVQGPSSKEPKRDNPPWDRSEIILALDLYLAKGPLAKTHPLVIELSEYLRQLPLIFDRPDPERFRNPAGVALKLANFKALDPSRPGGMDAYSKLDEEMWNRFHGDPAEVHALAEATRRSYAAEPGQDGSHLLGGFDVITAEEEGEDEVPEGRLLFRQHRRRERSSKLSKKKKAIAQELGALRCEVCEFDFKLEFGALGDGYIECHHIVPLSQSGETVTTLADLALLCSNCHRMAHRGSPWQSIEQLRSFRNN